MSTERLESMRQFAAQFPDNPFPQYALALELKALGRAEEAVETLAGLVARLPAYVPAYHQQGMLLDQLGRVDEARAVLTEGIARAKGSGNGHAAGEMQGLLDGLD